MTLRLYMDVHVDIAITRGLRERGIDVVTAQDDGTTEFPDTELMDRCLALGRVIFSYDQDFLVEAQRRQREGVEFGGVCHTPRRTLVVGRAIEDLELLAAASEPSEAMNRVIFLPLK